MQQNSFLRFHRAAEGAAIPALLIVSFTSLAVIVGAIAALAVFQTAWAFALTLLSLAATCAIVAGATLAALSDSDEPVSRRAAANATPGELRAPVPLKRPSPATSGHEPGREAA